MIDIRDIRTQEAYQAFRDQLPNLSADEKAYYEQQAREVIEEYKVSTSREPLLRVDEPHKPQRKPRGRRRRNP